MAKKLLCCILSFIPLPLFADMCTQAANTLRNYDVVASPPVDLFILQQQLGKPDIVKIFPRKILKWKYYTVILQDDKTILTRGLKPLGLGDSPTLNEVRGILGRPNSEVAIVMEQYTWQCRDTPSMITLLVGPENAVADITGIYCETADPRDCVLFHHEKYIFN